MALKRMAVQRINANAVSFPRAMLLGRVQPKFKDCTQERSAGVLYAMQVSLSGCASSYVLCHSAH